MTPEQALVAREAARRRTFAIISHPDAGKTTLTEKLLLYGGVIREAGSVRGRGAARHATSDWMAIEKERGISVSTSVLQFPFQGMCVNLLDTPGHDDFSEDTYRTLVAADCAVMLLDAAKGVEPQTIKLFKVCRMRRIPIVTFVNKMDRWGREPLELLDEIEEVLGIPATAATWPVGAGETFRGVFDRWNESLLLFDRGAGGSRRVPQTVASLADDASSPLPESARKQLLAELDLLETAGYPFDQDMFLAGEVTPVFFGSAITNFGVEPFLERFVELCPPPGPRQSDAGAVPIEGPACSGFVFKIQANMNPKHRDRIAFVRVCAGRFERGMTIIHERTGKPINVNRVMQLQSRERATVDEAFPGDIVGVWDGGLLAVGDSLYAEEPIRYEALPRFSPEHFVRVRLPDAMRRKQLRKGLEQLSEEGAVQLLSDHALRDPDPILGAVGPLQFDVVRHRLRDEYGVEATFSPLPYKHARWIANRDVDLDDVERRSNVAVCRDVDGHPLMLFKSDFEMSWVAKHCPELELVAAVRAGSTTPPAA
jgi:peptide chain release factor 3